MKSKWTLDARRGDIYYKVKLDGKEVRPIACNANSVLMYCREKDGGFIFCCEESCDCESEKGGFRHIRTEIMHGDVTIEKTR